MMMISFTGAEVMRMKMTMKRRTLKATLRKMTIEMVKIEREKERKE